MRSVDLDGCVCMRDVRACKAAFPLCLLAGYVCERGG